ncbi:MAG: T9SS type A sorting domain-containing protein [Flavobacteriales bacterium]
MKTLTNLFFVAVVTCLAACNQSSPVTPAAPQQEGFGVNPGSRKFYEYSRLKDPATGEIPIHMKSAVAEFASRLPRRSSDRSLSWTSRGPFNKGGRTRSLAYDVRNENIMLAGSVSGGVWRTTNGGQTWAKTTAPNQMHSVACIIQDTREGHQDTWYFGSGEEFYGVVSGTSFTSLFSGDGVYKSTDNGLTWSPLLSTSSNTPQNILQSGSYDFVQKMAIDPSNETEDEVYAAVYNGIIRSTDGGDSWEQVLGFGPGGSRYVDVVVADDGVVYASLSFANGANQGGVFRSDDGLEWTEITPDAWYDQQRCMMCFDPQDHSKMYLIGEMSNGANDINHILYRYEYLSGNGTGGGGVWYDLSANLPDDPCELEIGTTFDFGTFRSQNSYDLCIAHHPTEDILFIGGVNIHRSFSRFEQDDQDWIGGYRCNIENPLNYSYPNHHSDQHLMLFSQANPGVMFSANDGGVYRTDDALADSVFWTPLNNGYVTTQFYTVAMEQGYAETEYVFGGMQDNGTWITDNSNNQETWKEVHADDGAFCALPQGRNFIITSSQLGRMYKKTIDEQGNLLSTERIDQQSGPQYLFINPFILDPFTHNDVFIAGNRAIRHLANVNDIPVTGNYINKLPNEYWDNISESLVPTSVGAITTLDMAPIDHDVIYYGTSNGYVYRLDTTYTNPTRFDLTSDLFPTGAYTSCIVANDLNVEEVMVSFSNYNVQSIFHSSDKGETWENVSGNLEENPDGTGNGPAVYWVEMYPSDPVVYFAGTSAGLYSTSLLDGDNTVWEMEGAETIGNVVINMVKARPYDGTIAIATHGNGIYTASVEPVEAANVNELAVLKSDITVYPNPFSDVVQWAFKTRNQENIILEVYDISGKKVWNKSVKNATAGDQKIRWQVGSDLPKGTYIYKLSVGNLTKTGKIIH